MRKDHLKTPNYLLELFTHTTQKLDMIHLLNYTVIDGPIVSLKTDLFCKILV